MPTRFVFPASLTLVALVLASVYFLDTAKTIKPPQPAISQETVVATTTDSNSRGLTTPPPITTGVQTISMKTVASHNSAASCYTVVNGAVYDVTAWIAQHPGGSQAILMMCGVDGSSVFDGQHGGQRRPEAELSHFKISTLSTT